MAIARRDRRIGILVTLALGSAAAMAAPEANAQNWLLTPSIAVRETYTSNVDLTSDPQSAFVTSVIPALRVQGSGSRVRLAGTAAVEAQYYTAGQYETRLLPQINLTGTVEAVEKLFYVEGTVLASQQYISPYGPQPVGNIGLTGNRYTSYGYAVSPYFQGVLPGEIKYLLRDDNFWNNVSGDASGVPGYGDSYTNRLIGRLESPIRTLGVTAEIDRTYTSYSDGSPSLTLALARGTLNYRPATQWRLFGTGGYERNEGAVTDYTGAIYGGGAEWRRDDRTNALASWEQRFFGSSYLATLNHRAPGWALGLNASRTATTSSQLLFAAPANGNVAALVDAALTTRIPDPAQRAAATEQFLRQRGLPSQLQTPLNVSVQQIVVVEQQTVTGGLIGVRNSLVATLYNRKSEAVSAGGDVLPAGLAPLNDNTQRGGSLTFAHRLTPLTNLAATGTRFTTIATAPLTGRSTTNFLQVSATTRIGPKTDLFGGANYTDFNSDVATDYDVLTVFVGALHFF